MYSRLGFALLLSAILPLAICQKPAPALPYYDWKACPFETCTYGQWIARKPVEAWTTWQPDRKPVARIAKGDVVTALTGVVITITPGTIRMDRDLAEHNLHRGDIILTYAYRGEGVSAVWYNGRYDPDFDISFTKWPDGFGCGGDHCAATYIDLGKKDWWAQVKLKSGETAWIEIPDSFDFDIATRSQP